MLEICLLLGKEVKDGQMLPDDDDEAATDCQQHRWEEAMDAWITFTFTREEKR